MAKGEELRLLGALLVVVGLGLGAITPGNFISLVGLLLGLAALLFLLRGRPAHLLPWAAVALLAVALQAFGPVPGLALTGGTLLLLWSNRQQLLPARLPRRQLLWLGLAMALLGLFLPWVASRGGFVAGYVHQLDPLSDLPVSTFDPLATWVEWGRAPGRQLLGSLAPLFAWGALLYISLGRARELRRLGPPFWLLLLAWWLFHRSTLPGGLLYLIGTALVGLALLRATYPPARG